MLDRRYNFNRSTYAGETCKWIEVVDFIKKKQAVSKADIIKAIWPDMYDKCVIGGYQSNLFANINAKHPEGIYYDKSTRLWTCYSGM